MAVRKMYINIIDLIKWVRKRKTTEKPVQTLGTLGELRSNTKETGKIFRNTYRNEGNVVLKDLLRRIF
ncbi:uncharacterized protein PpBr36_11104 [Pyricularia pennisetigena]|uniref:uncharacterized protein n=1 Tax=Pyricularia pennisetigena TaxID=1578925 RepID=UPI0011526A2C|nr:uncharacterized protein PpBr36_11104 [Pyricularia pennisetigena]TLS20655.1 hypothetical protein PpBr36_11104 [Pyricularia pennisetigena]